MVSAALGAEAGLVVGGSTRVWSLIRDHTLAGASLEDLRAIGVRLAAALQAHQECSDEDPMEPGGPGSGHLLFAVGGINSGTDPATGATFGLDTGALGYGADEVGWYSYRADRASYEAPDTWGDLLVAAYRLRDQLRNFTLAHPHREVDLIAHSQGGIVVDAFLQLVYRPEDPTLPPLGNAVTLASPHGGAPLATIAAAVRTTPAGRAAMRAAETVAGGAVPTRGRDVGAPAGRGIGPHGPTLGPRLPRPDERVHRRRRGRCRGPGPGRRDAGLRTHDGQSPGPERPLGSPVGSPRDEGRPSSPRAPGLTVRGVG